MDSGCICGLDRVGRVRLLGLGLVGLFLGLSKSFGKVLGTKSVILQIQGLKVSFF